MRKPPRFRAPRTGSRHGILLVREGDDGTWVVLASPPDVKVDNRHRDRRPHIHTDGWQGNDRRDLRADLTLEEVVLAIRRRLEATGWIDVEALRRELA